MEKQIKGIIFFDIDDTLINTTEFVSFARNESFNSTLIYMPDIAKSSLEKNFSKVYSELGSNSTKHYDELFSRLGIQNPIQKDFLVALAVHSYHEAKRNITRFTEKNLEKLLRNLSKDYLLGIVSSGVGVKQMEKLIRTNISSFFQLENIYITESQNFQKNPEFYEKIFSHYSSKYQTQNIWMVGDREDNDIVPAKYSGLKTIRINRGKYNFDFNQSIADSKIYNLNEIEGILKNN